MAEKIDPADAYDTLTNLVRQIEAEEADVVKTKERIKEVYREAKDAGFDTKIMRKLIMKRRKDPEELRAVEEQVERYEAAIELSPTNQQRKTA